MLALYCLRNWGYIRNWLKCQRGQDIIEYALLVGFIAVVALVGIMAAGEGVSDLFNRIALWVTGIQIPEGGGGGEG